MGDQFAFFWPNPAVSEALAFIGPRLPKAESERWILMIGPTNELGANAVKIAWSEQLGRSAPGVDLVPEAAEAERRQTLVEKLSSMQPARIVGVGVKPGSRLDSGDFHHTWPSQPDYYRAATALEREGLLRRLAGTRTSDAALEITLWELAPGFAQRFGGP
jgi:hypothetical protein